MATSGLRAAAVVSAAASSVAIAAARAAQASDAACRPQGAKRRRLSLSGCGSKRRATGAATPQVGRRPRPIETETSVSGGLLACLDEGAYFVVTQWLNATDLSRADATCRLLLSLNSQPIGAWHAAGDRAFYGMELEVNGGFLPFDTNPTERSRSACASLGTWKSSYQTFHKEVPMFSAPFSGTEIVSIEQPDEVAYCKCRLRTDLLAARPDRSVYVEVEVVANADNLSLAIVDFEGGGRSSVTFSPETGAVLRERKVHESPRAIEGTYIHLLPAAAPGCRFEGTMGLYLHKGHLAFFRRWRNDSEGGDAKRPWETTGFCTDLGWAQGPRLSLCLAFRDDGPYKVRIARVCSEPPVLTPRSQDAYQDAKWNLLYGDDDHPLAI